MTALKRYEMDRIESAEYVLRLMTREQERDFEERMIDDAHLEGEVAFWVDRFSALSDEVPATQPSRKIRTRLMTELFGEEPEPPAYWETVEPWKRLTRGLAAVAAVLAVVALASFILGTRNSGPEGPLYVSEVASQGSDVRLLTVFDPESGELRVTRTAGEPSPGNNFQLWAVKDGEEPVALISLPADRDKLRVEIPDILRGDLASMVFAVSEEAEGSPAGPSPSGSILAAGRMEEL